MANKNKIPTPELLRKLLDVDYSTGLLTWRKRDASFFEAGKPSAQICANRWNGRFSGSPAFMHKECGYMRGMIFKRHFSAHRVIFTMYYDIWPEYEIDHINGIKSDNRIENLRSVTRQENSRNLSISRRNTSGYMGVSWSNNQNKWLVQINVDGKRKRIGCFENKQDAVAARLEAGIKYGYHENHGKEATE